MLQCKCHKMASSCYFGTKPPLHCTILEHILLNWFCWAGPRLLCNQSIPIVGFYSQFYQQVAGVEVGSFCLLLKRGLLCQLQALVILLVYYCPLEEIQTNY
jgi:hypothetical protein